MHSSSMRARDFDDISAIERAAAEWVVRRQNGLTEAEEKEFENWLKGAQQRSTFFAEMEETSQMLDQLRKPARAGEAATADFRAIPGRRRADGRSQTWWLSMAGLAAAAAVLVAIKWRQAPTGPDYAQVLATDVGELRRFALPDGSVIHLNTDSSARVNFNERERRVELSRGEAFFSVAPQPRQPFWVEAGAVSVRAVGTAFNVRLKSQSVEVVVKEGKVSVDQSPPGAVAAASMPRSAPAEIPSRSKLVAAGEKAIVSLAKAPDGAEQAIVVAELASPQIENALVWQTRRLEFSGTPLSEVVAEFNRYNRHQLVIADEALGSQSFGGAFAPERWDALVEILEQGFGVSAERNGQVITLRRNQLVPEP